jgi:hypothetical protein
LPAQYVIIFMTSVLGPIIVLALQFSNALDIQFVRIENDPVGARCSVAGMPDAIWINLAISGAAVVVLFVMAALGPKLHIPPQAPMVIAKIVLGFTVAATVWTAVAVLLTPPPEASRTTTSAPTCSTRVRIQRASLGRLHAD